MTIDAGDYLTPPRLNPVAFQLQLAAQYTMTSTPTDLTLTNVTPGYASGATSFVVPENGWVGLAVWQGDFLLGVAGSITAATVDFVIDGAIPVNSPEAIWDPGNISDGRATVPGSWPFSLAAGSHTFGLRAGIVSTSGTVRLQARHTCLSILLHP